MAPSVLRKTSLSSHHTLSWIEWALKNFKLLVLGFCLLYGVWFCAFVWLSLNTAIPPPPLQLTRESGESEGNIHHHYLHDHSPQEHHQLHPQHLRMHNGVLGLKQQNRKQIIEEEEEDDEVKEQVDLDDEIEDEDLDEERNETLLVIDHNSSSHSRDDDDLDEERDENLLVNDHNSSSYSKEEGDIDDEEEGDIDDAVFGDNTEEESDLDTDLEYDSDGDDSDGDIDNDAEGDDPSQDKDEGDDSVESEDFQEDDTDGSDGDVDDQEEEEDKGHLKLEWSGTNGKDGYDNDGGFDEQDGEGDNSLESKELQEELDADESDGDVDDQEEDKGEIRFELSDPNGDDDEGDGNVVDQDQDKEGDSLESGDAPDDEDGDGKVEWGIDDVGGGSGDDESGDDDGNKEYEEEEKDEEGAESFELHNDGGEVDADDESGSFEFEFKEDHANPDSNERPKLREKELENLIEGGPKLNANSEGRPKLRNSPIFQEEGQVQRKQQQKEPLTKIEDLEKEKSNLLHSLMSPPKASQPPNELPKPKQPADYSKYTNPGVLSEGCDITAVLMDPRIIKDNPGHSLWNSLESLADMMRSDRACVLILTSVCQSHDGLPGLYSVIEERSPPKFRENYLDQGKVRVSILDHNKYRLQSCFNFWNPSTACINANFWTDEFNEEDSDFILTFQEDTVFCLPFYPDLWRDLAYVGGVWPPEAFTHNNPSPPEGTCAHMPQRWKLWTGENFPVKFCDRVHGIAPLGNGGFTLRSRSWAVKAIRHCPHPRYSGLSVAEVSAAPCQLEITSKPAEDLYFGTVLRGMGAPLPTGYEASLFSVEMLFPDQVLDYYYSGVYASTEHLESLAEKRWGDLELYRRLKSLPGHIVPIGFHKPYWYFPLDVLLAEPFRTECPYLVHSIPKDRIHKYERQHGVAIL